VPHAGSLVLTFTCADTYEVAAWVASWRDGVEVLEPESLRDSFSKLGEHYRELYA
jgi:predicted DNA-binding transcriptional regulator YafY